MSDVNFVSTIEVMSSENEDSSQVEVITMKVNYAFKGNVPYLRCRLESGIHRLIMEFKVQFPSQIPGIVESDRRANLFYNPALLTGISESLRQLALEAHYVRDSYQDVDIKLDEILK